MTQDIVEIMRISPVIPVITIDDLDDALPLAEALLEGGLKVLELTLRTPSALPAITQLRKALPEAVIGAGTVINPQSWSQAVDAGATFIVSPGVTDALLDSAAKSTVPILPGVNTPSEIMHLLEHGIRAMKFFPAQAAGGIAMLKAIAAPLPQALFCPTGGISPDNAADYLALPNVACVGGSWMLKPELIASRNWQAIRQLAGEAAQLSA